MYVVKVMPIARGAFKDSLSFFSKTALLPGVLVEVPLRGKKTPALILESIDAREEKSVLRSESFALKKLEPKIIGRIFSKETIDALKEVAQYHGIPDGTVVSHVTPNAILHATSHIEEAPATEEARGLAADCLALQAEYDERVATYRNTTRELFAKGESVLLVAPTIPEAEKLYTELSRGIEEQTLLLTSQLTKKASIAAWNRAAVDPEPLLIILTHSFLTIPRKDVGSIFIERESARSYLSREAPHIDVRECAEALARKRGVRLVYCDFPLRVETHARLRDQSLDEFSRLQRTTRSTNTVRIVDARPKETDIPKKKKFSSLTDPVHTLLTTELERGSRIFVYAARRGIAPLTVCNDCGTPVTDPSTGTPMTLHKTKEGNVFLSFRSGAVLPAHTTCRNCGGWNLVSLGIGVERVFDDLKKMFPESPLFMLTTETAATHTAAKKIASQFFNTRGAILIGTDRALPYLYEPVEYTVVSSVDSILSSSAWRAHTHALHTLFYLHSRSSEGVYVQTRLPDAPVIRAFATGNPIDFIEQELSDRKTFGYPPYMTFIGLTWNGTENAVQKIGETVAETLKEWELVGPLPPRAKGKNRFVGRAVIRLDKNIWPDPLLIKKLKVLAPQVAVSVDPDDIV